MSRHIMSVALLGAFLVAAPAKADAFTGFTQFAPGEFETGLQQFMEWRETDAKFNGTNFEKKGIRYEEGSTVELLFAWYRDGDQGASNGAMQTWTYGGAEGAFYLDRVAGNDFIFGINGSAFAAQGIVAPYIVDWGIALVGSRGDKGNNPLWSITGMMRDFSMYVDGAWYNLGTALSSLAGMLGFDIDDQQYLNGVKIANNNTVSNAYDKSFTFIRSDMFTDMLGGGGDIGGVFAYDDIRFRFDNRLRNQNGLTFIGVVAPSEVPEPATLAIVGLGLAGLGLARRRRK